jgi:UDP-N-acetylmuramate--alanine ligase
MSAAPMRPGAMSQGLQRLHFVGVGGSGMGPLAEIMAGQGYRVSGSDLAENAVTARLRSHGVAVHIGHAAGQLADAEAVVISSAVRPDNPELVAARAAGLPVVARAQLLAELMRTRQGVAVAGTHGKTTTTALVARVLAEAGADPGWVIGGEPLNGGQAAHLGHGGPLVAEADESDASFLHLSPVVAVVTNIDADHMETYGQRLERLHQAFVQFVQRLPFYGHAVVCSDDPGVLAVAPLLGRRAVSYGLGDAAALRATEVQAHEGGCMRFTARQAGWPDLALTLRLAGSHNVLNALAALAVARILVPAEADAAAARAFATFAGVGRRFQRHGPFTAAGGGRYLVVDDYGHHPVELAAVLAAARGAFPGRRLVLAFQPHRYTRTRDCFAAFAQVLRQADSTWITAVYAAGEPPIEGADAVSLAAAVPGARYVAEVPALATALHASLAEADVLLALGAGSIAALPAALQALSSGGSAP